jgi:hypothetical protein
VLGNVVKRILQPSRVVRSPVAVHAWPLGDKKNAGSTQKRALTRARGVDQLMFPLTDERLAVAGASSKDRKRRCQR